MPKSRAGLRGEEEAVKGWRRRRGAGGGADLQEMREGSSMLFASRRSLLHSSILWEAPAPLHTQQLLRLVCIPLPPNIHHKPAYDRKEKLGQQLLFINCLSSKKQPQFISICSN